MIDRSLYIGMNGAKHAMISLQVIANNMANVNTSGFRADLAYFKSVPVGGDGLPTRVHAITEKPVSDFTPGAIIETGRNLDIAIKDQGWIAVQTQEGRQGLTRAGALQVSATGLLQTKRGDLVLGNQGTIAIPPAQKINIGSDGTISIVPLGQPESAITTVDRIKLVNPPKGALLKGDDGLFYLKGGAGAQAENKVEIISGSLETSNVNIVSSLVDMIELSRNFEIQVKGMQTAAENADQANQILRVSES